MQRTLKPSAHTVASVLSAPLIALLATTHAWAQSTPAVPQPGAQATEATPGGINPMTGRPLSEEELHRQLNKSKLMTQLGQEQVKQAQNAADLTLANLRAETEKTRARAETLAQLPTSSTSKAGGITTIKPTPLPAPNANAGLNSGSGQPAGAAQAGQQPTAWGQTMPAPQAATKASGTIRIGDETQDVATSAPIAAPALVQWVDSQTRQVARAGSPLQPIQVQPANGVLGIPAIPGMVPGIGSSGQSQ
jgi:hypothetical protein